MLKLLSGLILVLSMYPYFSVSDELQCGYCGTVDHKTLFCLERSIADGAAGRWEIPSVGVNVAAYPGSAQEIVDFQDSAAYYSYGTQQILADHDYQGFDRIKDCKVGTSAYLNTSDGTQEYICTAVFKGYNTGPELTDLNGKVLTTGNGGGITCYTCDIFRKTITIVYFQPVA